MLMYCGYLKSFFVEEKQTNTKQTNIKTNNDILRNP